jgi:ribosomal protein L11
MKPFNLDICLKRSSIYWKKSTPKTTIVRANILAGKAIKQPPLGSVLGTYGVNAENFCTQFNAATMLTHNQTVKALLPTVITISPGRTFSFKTLIPTVHSLFRAVLPTKALFRAIKGLSCYKMILLTTLYKVVVIRTGSLLENTLSNLLLQIFSVLHTYDLHEIGEKSTSKGYFRRRKR